MSIIADECEKEPVNDNISVINHKDHLRFVFLQKGSVSITVYCSCAEWHQLPRDPNKPVETSAHHSDMQCIRIHGTHQLQLQLLENQQGAESLSLPSG